MTFTNQIKSTQKAKDFLTYLNDTDQLFHPEDNPRDIISNTTKKRLFNESQCLDLDQRIEEVFFYLDDPCQFILDEFYKPYNQN